MSYEIRILIILITLGFLVDILLFLLFRHSEISPWLIHTYSLFEYILIMFVLRSWQESHRVRQFFFGMIGFYILFWFFAKYTIEPFDGVDYLTASASKVIIILSAGYTLFIVAGNWTQSLKRDKRFWILLAFVLYNMGTLVPVAMQELFTKLQIEDILLAWSVNWIMAIISSILYTVGFLCIQTRT